MFQKVKNQSIIISLSALLLISCGGENNSSENDEALNNCIHDTLHLADYETPSQKQLESIINLSCEEKKISKISALSDLKNLESLSLGNNYISNLGPLSNLKNLETLIISDNPISDLSGLAKLSLKNLELNNTRIKDSDLHFLQNLGSLKDLSISNNKITNINFISKLTNLVDLNVSHNKIVDINVLGYLTNLTTLYINDNLIEDISILEEIPLRDLNLTSNCINDFLGLPIESMQQKYGVLEGVNSQESACLKEIDFKIPGALLSPNKGVTLPLNSIQEITWNSNLFTENTVSLYILHNNESEYWSYNDPSDFTSLSALTRVMNWHEFAKDVPNNGRFSINTSALVDGGKIDNYWILITTDSKSWDIVGGFSIYEPEEL